jgi:hypothetical protein
MRVTDVNTYKASTSSASHTTIMVLYIVDPSVHVIQSGFDLSNTARGSRFESQSFHALGCVRHSHIRHFLLLVLEAFYSRWLGDADLDPNSSQSNSQT